LSNQSFYDNLQSNIKNSDLFKDNEENCLNINSSNNYNLNLTEIIDYNLENDVHCPNKIIQSKDNNLISNKLENNYENDDLIFKN